MIRFGVGTGLNRARNGREGARYSRYASISHPEKVEKP